MVFRCDATKSGGKFEKQITFLKISAPIETFIYNGFGVNPILRSFVSIESILKPKTSMTPEFNFINVFMHSF